MASTLEHAARTYVDTGNPVDFSNLAKSVYDTEPSAETKRYIKAAARIHASDGYIEIDDDAIVSISDDGGAYVQAWVWVDDDQVEK